MGELIEVVVGTVGRAHGLKGEVAIEVRTDEPERRFASGQVLRTTEGRKLVVAGTRLVSGRLLVRFDAVPDRTAAEALRGAELVADVPSSERPEHEEEYYDRQLVDLEVRDAAGVASGTVTEVLHGPAQDILVIETSGGERLVPFVRALVPTVDLADGYLQLADVGGLLADEPEGPRS